MPSAPRPADVPTAPGLFAPVRGGIYCRLSVDDANNSAKAKNYIPSDESTSIENQRELLSKFVMLNGYLPSAPRPADVPTAPGLFAPVRGERRLSACTIHTIDERALYQIVLEDIRAKAQYAAYDRDRLLAQMVPRFVYR